MSRSPEEKGGPRGTTPGEADNTDHNNQAADAGQSKAQPVGHQWPEPEPEWEGEGSPVDGADLLDDMERFAGRYLALPTQHHLVVLCLWALHTWALSAFYVTARLVLQSPEYGCGKTRALEVLRQLCWYPRLILSTSAAALFRRIDGAGDRPPTILQDEADAIWGRGAETQAQELRGVYDSGYRRGATVDRCVGDGRTRAVQEFKVFAPAALAGLEGKIPRSITSRGLTMHIRRRPPDREMDSWHERDTTMLAAPLRSRIQAWSEANFDELEKARPTMPDGVRDRRAEVWEALLAVADVAGGDWPQRARAACRFFEFDSDPDAQSLGIRLLRNIRDVFGGQDRMFSLDLVPRLIANPEWEWSDLWGKSLDQRRLAKELRRYGVHSKDVRIGNEKAKGYEVDGEDGLGQAWRSYIADKEETPKKPPTSETSETSETSQVRDISDPRHVRDTSKTNQAPLTMSRTVSDDRDTSETEKVASDQAIPDPVSAASDASDKSGAQHPHGADFSALMQHVLDHWAQTSITTQEDLEREFPELASEVRLGERSLEGAIEEARRRCLTTEGETDGQSDRAAGW